MNLIVNYQKDILKWYELVRIVDEAVGFVKFQGIYGDCDIDLMELPTFEARTKQSKRVREELLDFIGQEAQNSKGNERLLG